MRTPTPANRSKRSLQAELRMRELTRRTSTLQNQLINTRVVDGCVGRNIRTTLPATATTTAVPVLSVTAPVLAGRLYEVKALHFGLYGTVAGTMQANLTYTTDGSAVTAASPALDQVDVQSTTGGIPEDAQLNRLVPITADGTLAVLLSYTSPSAGTGRMNASAGWPIELAIFDLGLDPGLTGTVY